MPRRAFPGILGLVLLAGALLRAGYLLVMDLPVFDPWRHLQLVENIRAGRGFTLFDGQPYLWYHPLWYYLSAALPRGVGNEWLAALCSWLSVAALAVWLRGTGAPSRVALSAAVMMALSGPVIAFTCHYGPEGLALFLTLASLAWAASRQGTPAALGAGILFGLALAARMNLAVNLFLFFPLLRTKRRAAAWAAGAAVPLAMAWWRNHAAIASHRYLFTWDGLAARTADFNPLSTLVIQMHPTVTEGLRRLHLKIAPYPVWYRNAEGIAWEPLLFVLTLLAGVILSRRIELILAGAATALLVFSDPTQSSNFFRVTLALFPVFFAGAALAVERLSRVVVGKSRVGSLTAAGLVAFVIVLGAGHMRPAAMFPLEAATPPPEILTEEAYLVNSAFFHPESLIRRFPGKRFVGLPLEPAQVDDFLEAFPGYRTVLWHDYSIQDEVLTYLVDVRGYEVVRRGANAWGRTYAVLKPRRRESP
jgi:hypothetical protein